MFPEILTDFMKHAAKERSPPVRRKKKAHSPSKHQPPPYTGLGQNVDQLNHKLFQSEIECPIKPAKIQVHSPEYKHLKHSKTNVMLRLYHAFLSHALKKRGDLDHTYVGKLAKALNLPVTKQALDK